jgi:single-stranded-DNA-specific exonuclease
MAHKLTFPMIRDSLLTAQGYQIRFLSENHESGFLQTLLKNRGLAGDDTFFRPSFSHLLDPFLFPDMEKAVERITLAKEQKERVVVFGDYDVDGVSSTAMLVRFFHEQ